MVSKINSPKSICKQFNIDDSTFKTITNKFKSNQLQFKPNHVSLFLISTLKMQLEHVKKYLTQHNEKLIDGIISKNKPNTRAYAINHFHLFTKQKLWPNSNQKLRELKSSEFSWLKQLLDENKILRKYNDTYDMIFMIGHIKKTFALATITRHKPFEYRSDISHLELVSENKCIEFIESLRSDLRLPRKNKRQNKWSNKNGGKRKDKKQLLAKHIDRLRFKTMQHIKENNINAAKDDVCLQIFQYAQEVSNNYFEWNTFFTNKPIKGWRFYVLRSQQKCFNDFFQTVGTKQQIKFCNS